MQFISFIKQNFLFTVRYVSLCVNKRHALSRKMFRVHKYVMCTRNVLVCWQMQFYYVLFPLFFSLSPSCALLLLTVPEYGICVHANIQFNLHDAVDWPLERMSTVFGSNAARISVKLLGCHQRTAGEIFC